MPVCGLKWPSNSPCNPFRCIHDKLSINSSSPKHGAFKFTCLPALCASLWNPRTLRSSASDLRLPSWDETVAGVTDQKEPPRLLAFPDRTNLPFPTRRSCYKNPWLIMVGPRFVKHKIIYPFMKRRRTTLCTSENQHVVLWNIYIYIYIYFFGRTRTGLRTQQTRTRANRCIMSKKHLRTNG